MAIRSVLEGLVVGALGALPPAVQRRLAGGRPLVHDGQTLAPELQLLLALIERRGGPGLTDLPPEASRRKYAREVKASSGRPAAVRAVRELRIPGPVGPLRARHYLPHGPPAPLLVYFHGGGFVLGDLETHDAPCRFLCREGPLQLLAVEYRLAPEHRLPAGLDDARGAFAWARENAASFGARPEELAVGGDSAGANLAARVAQLAPRDAQPALQLLLYPAVDRVQPWRSLELFAEGFPLTRKDVAWFEEQASEPGTTLLGPDLRGLAPALIATAGFDPLRDEGEAYAAALRAAGTRVVLRRFEGLVHGFVHLLGASRTSREALRELARTARSMLAEAAAHEPARSEAAAR